MPQEVHASHEGTTSEDYSDCYYNEAHLGGYDDYRWENERWRDFFTMVADRIIAVASPTTVLDVGCAKGLLVQGLALRGVDAHGIDVSSHAIENAHADVRGRLTVASATKPITGQWSLVTCVEVLEHLSPADAQLALDNICAVTDLVLFSSSPGDFDEPTHINTHPTSVWAQWFAERGFFRRTDVDLAFLSPWAVLFDRTDPDPRTLVHRYESLLTPLTSEVVEKRASLLQAHRNVSSLHDQIKGMGGDSGDYALTKQHAANLEAQLEAVNEEITQVRHNRLTLRDHVIGTEAEAARLGRELTQEKKRTRRLSRRIEELKAQLMNERTAARQLRKLLGEVRQPYGAAAAGAAMR